MPDLDWLTARPIAHRGLHDADAGIIENTLSAAEAAIAGGYSIELDIQPDADDEPVVFHDATLDRVTEGSGPVSAIVAKDLAGIPLKGTSDRIVTLSAFLEAVGGRVPVVVEIKGDWTNQTGFFARTAAAVKACNGPVAVMSFDPGAVAFFRKHHPGVPRGVTATRFDSREARRLSPLRRFILTHMLHALHTRPQFIAYHTLDLPALAPNLLRRVPGLPVLTWTVRTGQEEQRVAPWADQIIFEGFIPRGTAP